MSDQHATDVPQTDPNVSGEANTRSNGLRRRRLNALLSISLLWFAATLVMAVATVATAGEKPDDARCDGLSAEPSDGYIVSEKVLCVLNAPDISDYDIATLLAVVGAATLLALVAAALVVIWTRVE